MCVCVSSWRMFHRYISSKRQKPRARCRCVVDAAQISDLDETKKAGALLFMKWIQIEWNNVITVSGVIHNWCLASSKLYQKSICDACEAALNPHHLVGLESFLLSWGTCCESVSWMMRNPALPLQVYPAILVDILIAFFFADSTMVKSQNHHLPPSFGEYVVLLFPTTLGKSKVVVL